MNLRDVMLICKSSIGHMLDQESRGSIVMVSSVTARDGGSPNASYLKSKNGLNAYTGRYYGARSIRCNCICPEVLEQTPNTIYIPIRTVALRGWRHLFR